VLKIFCHTLQPRYGGQAGVGSVVRNLLAGFDLIGLPYRREPSDRPRSFFGRCFCNRFINEQRDTLRCSDADQLLYPNYFLPFAPPRRGNRIVVVHDVLFADCPESVGRTRRLWLEVWLGSLVRRPASVIFVSQFSFDRYVAHFGRAPARYAIIPDPIDEKRWRFRPVPPSGDKPTIVAVSAYYLHKNFETFIRLASFYGTQARFIAIGLPPSPRQLKKMIDGDPDVAAHVSKVEFTGYLPARKLTDVVSKASAFVCTSRYEGFGMPPVEAVALGVPVVASGLAALRQNLGGKAEFVDELDDLGAWRRRIDRVLSDPPSLTDRRNWSLEICAKFGRASVARRYSEQIELA
jgi:glycosyltransferase involved in cell wall biosynthesis